jgi:hypothetical protein
LSTGAIVGTAIGAVAAGSLMIALGFQFVRLRRKRQRELSQATPSLGYTGLGNLWISAS